VRLAGKIALVTGAAKGIGRGCALELAREGADLVVNDLHRSAEAEEVAGLVRGLGRRAEIVEGDVFERASCERVAARAVEAFGRLDVLVSNPAQNRKGAFLDYDPDDFDAVIRATLTGGFHMSQLVARHMAARGGGGKIIFISSLHSIVPYAGSVAYNAAKSAVTSMAFTIAAELLPHRINVNVIDPGWIDTPGEEAIYGRETMDRAAEGLPWGRLGRPEDVAKAAAYLASDDADYVTGVALRVDGGLWLNEARKGD
jgi:glucose 1-dehydrogenase